MVKETDNIIRRWILAPLILIYAVAFGYLVGLLPYYQPDKQTILLLMGSIIPTVVLIFFIWEIYPYKVRLYRMIQQTSILAYHTAVLPQLGKKQKVVFNGFRDLGNATDKEVSQHLMIPINEVTPRRGELVKACIMEYKGVKKNKQGRTVNVWGIR